MKENAPSSSPSASKPGQDAHKLMLLQHKARTNSGYLRLLLALVFAALTVSPALTYGSVWNLQAHPIEDATVRLDDGQTLRGRLSRDWTTAWVLTQSDGRQVLFHSAIMISRPSRAEPSLSSLLQSWRAQIPFLLLLAVIVAITRGRSRRTDCDLATTNENTQDHVGEVAVRHRNAAPDDECSALLHEQVTRWVRSPWSPVQRFLKAAFILATGVWMLDFVAMGLGLPAVLPFWAQAVSGSVTIASFVVFIVSTVRDDYEHLPDPLRSWLKNRE
jgi:hypothetical protein